jgi:hypothetical protein
MKSTLLKTNINYTQLRGSYTKHPIKLSPFSFKTMAL